MKLGFSRKIFEKYSNIEFHENPSRELNCSLRTDRHGGTNSRVSPFFERSKKILKLKSKWNIGPHVFANTQYSWQRYVPSPLSASLTIFGLFYLYTKNIGGTLQFLSLMLWYAQPKRLSTPAVDLIREVPVPVRVSTVTPAIMTFREFTQFSQPDLGYYLD
jgi:hypothetical protein